MKKILSIIMTCIVIATWYGDIHIGVEMPEGPGLEPVEV